MNLQQHIEQKAEAYSSFYLHGKPFKKPYKAGFHAALDLELPIKFAEWLINNSSTITPDENEEINISQLYSRFLETLEL